MEKTKSFQYIGVGVVALLAIITVILFAVPVSVTYQETYPGQESYQRYLNYTVIDSGYSEDLSGINMVTNGWVEIENTDTEPGTFVVNCSFRTLDGLLYDSDRVYMEPGESKQANCQVDTELGEDKEFAYDVKPEAVTETRAVQKTRPATKQVKLYQSLFGLY